VRYYIYIYIEISYVYMYIYTYNIYIYIYPISYILYPKGDHQENQLRTEQLIGPNGCLRRYALQNSIEWQGEGDIVPAALTDLLRVHEYAYIAHLENKVW
jgi:hypothetical protein